MLATLYLVTSHGHILITLEFGKVWSHLSGVFVIQVDPFHTLFGLAGLSLLGNRDLKEVNPVLCMPEEVLIRRGLTLKLLS